ncbi:uncharacterized protein LOC130635832 isoform X2 [Hydractinia symbiolongicarpus]|uniref:uncharacterized protein LOC130635832 isoform X2 n=1 Tax=Hydractinia symbiolongicarpus TaxID=13093 RepID=UPI00254F7181|nr:uncharacterized protein LOC130635832 isoform X2 [Hydractinia symbiolongicarpus]
MLINIIRSHQGYIDRQMTSRPLLTMMTKIRAAQTLGAALSDKGRHTCAYDLYLKTINQMLDSDMQTNFSIPHIMKLENAIRLAENETQKENKTWLLRSNLDSVYDECISMYNAVDSQKPPNLQEKIKDTINSVLPDVDAGDYKASLQKYTALLKHIQNEKRYRNLMSAEALKLLDESIEKAEASDDMEHSVSQVRESLDRIYNEVRLPNVYSPEKFRQVNRPKAKTQNAMMMINFQKKDDSLFEYNIQGLDDRVMNGESESNVEFLENEAYVKFVGTISRANRGGFASFRVVPSQKAEMCKVLTGTRKIIIEVKNLAKTNSRYKFQLANEAHLKSFNWQSEFFAEPNEDFKKISLDVQSFWPTMFGHVLSSPGDVDFTKVDCLGIILSHVTVDGNNNPDLVEGEFGLAVRSISIVKDS